MLRSSETWGIGPVAFLVVGALPPPMAKPFPETACCPTVVTAPMVMNAAFGSRGATLDPRAAQLVNWSTVFRIKVRFMELRKELTMLEPIRYVWPRASE